MVLETFPRGVLADATFLSRMFGLLNAANQSNSSAVFFYQLRYWNWKLLDGLDGVKGDARAVWEKLNQGYRKEE